MQNIGISVIDSLTTELNSHLQHLMNVPSRGENCDESKNILVKGIVEDFIEKCSQSKVSQDDIRKGLAKIYGNELLLSKEVYESALEKIAVVPQPSSNSSPDSSEEEQVAELPLFCEDTVYHASLCCLAVSTKDATNFKGFFDREYPNHHFEEASLSQSHDRYLIAKKGNTYFIAFRSEPSFSEWPKLFKSFEHG